MTSPEAGPAYGAAGSPAPHDPPPGARLMNALRWGLFAFLLLLAFVSIGSYLLSRPGASRGASEQAHVRYQCPMHPNVTSEQPGTCPICGMKLERVTITEPSPDGAPAAGGVPGLTEVTLSPERIQLIGVRTAIVVSRPMGGELELVGFVTPDESRLHRVQLRVSGWVRELYANETGARVSVGQPLLALDSPELVQTEQEYLIARGHTDLMPGMATSDSGNAAGATRERLRWLQVPEDEIARLEREGRPARRLVLRSPVAGTVLERGVTQGQYVGADTPLLTVADLSRVWVLADVYEMDFTRVREGDPARFRVDALPGREFTGRLQFVYPTVSTETRTLKARLELANPTGLLRPGMFGRVRVDAPGAPALSVPDEAVVQAGDHAYVFVAHAGGRFEPRLVTTGITQGDRVAVLSGLAAGDTVVASASFLIDSESRLRAALSGAGGAANEPVEHAHGGGR